MKTYEQLERENRKLRSQLERMRRERARREDLHEADKQVWERVLRERDEAERERDAISARLHSIVEDERRKLSRDLHDSAGQVITGIRQYAQIARDAAADMVADDAASAEQARERVAHAANQISHFAGALTDATREVLRSLWPEALDHYGLHAALDEHLARWRERHPSVTVEASLAKIAPFEHAILVYRIAVEWLTNVSRYAHASRVRVSLTTHEPSEAPTGSTLDGPYGLLVIADDGAGFDARETVQTGRGLLSIRERARTLQSDLDIDSRPGEGATLTLRFPLPDSSDDEPSA